MATWQPDPSFYPSPRMAMKAPKETLAYVATFDPERKEPDAIAAVDVDPASSSYSKIVGQTYMPNTRRRTASLRLECLQFLPLPKRAASPCRAPLSGGAGPALLARLHPRHQARPGQSRDRQGDRARGDRREDRLHPAAHHPLRPRGHLCQRLGNADGEAPGGIFLMDHETFDVRGRWEVERGPQQLAYDFWWHLGYDTMVTSEWGTPETFEEGSDPRAPARQQVRPPAAFLGPAQALPSAERSISARSISSSSSSGRRTIRPRPMASSAW